MNDTPIESIAAVVVDDFGPMRELVCKLLEADGIIVLATARDGQEAVEVVRQYQPDVVVMDINMPKMDGAEATRQIHRECPQIKIMIFSGDCDPTWVDRALAAGANGYVDKSGIKSIAPSIREIMAGGLVLRLPSFSVSTASV